MPRSFTTCCDGPKWSPSRLFPNLQSRCDVDFKCPVFAPGASLCERRWTCEWEEVKPSTHSVDAVRFSPCKVCVRPPLWTLNPAEEKPVHPNTERYSTTARCDAGSCVVRGATLFGRELERRRQQSSCSRIPFIITAAQDGNSLI